MWHMQRTTPDWPDSVHILPDSASIKATGGYEIFREIKAINPRIFTIHRMVRADQEHYWGTADSPWFDWETAKNKARRWFDSFVDGTFYQQHQYHTDAVSWHNEVWADSQTQIERDERVASHMAAAHIWNSEYRPKLHGDIQLIIGEAAPGNGMDRKVAEIAIETDNIVGYHPYEWWRKGIRSDYGWRRMTSQRFDVMEQAWGLKPVWAFTEAGPLESAITGWRAQECLGGNASMYVEAVRLWIKDVQQMAAYQDGRVRGFNLFTTFSRGDEKWGSFHTGQPEMNSLAMMIRDNWKPGEYVDPDPDPDPPIVVTSLQNGSFEDGWTDIDNRAQQANHWLLQRKESGEVRGRKITGTTECVHKLASQLPADEQPGGVNALILDGEASYKIFLKGVHQTEKSQLMGGFIPGQEVTFQIPFNIHFDGRGDIYDEDDTLFRVIANDSVEDFWMTKEFDREWHYIQITCMADEDGEILLTLHFSVKWEHDTAIFIDHVTQIAGTTPPPPADTFEQKAWDVTSEMQITGQGGLRLNADAAIQHAVSVDNLGGLDLQIVTDEVVVDGMTCQAAESLTNMVPRRVYVWEAGEQIWWFSAEDLD